MGFEIYPDSATNQQELLLGATQTGTVGGRKMGAVDVAIKVRGAGEWTVSVTSGANTSATATKAAVAGQIHVITGYLVVIRGAVAANDISAVINDGATVKLTDYIGSGAARGARILATDLNIEGTANTAATLVVAAGGAGVIAELTLIGYTKNA